MIDINWNPSEREKRQFAAIWLPAFFVLLGAIVFWRTRSLTIAGVILGCGLVLTGAALLVPAIRRPLFVGWMCAAFPIGWTVSHIILAFIFYLVITPIGLLMRLFGRDPLQRAFDRQATTYWVEHHPAGETSQYFRQF